MLYPLVKIWARLGLMLYCRKIDAAGFRIPGAGTPLVIAANHPNSFFDAILLGALSPRPLHFMTRGDAFRNPRVSKILRALHMIPIHRLSEGKEHLHLNDESFSECVRILQDKGAILIFSEGLCVNEWTLRALKKGTARLAYQAWLENGLGIMQVLPLGLSYDSFSQVPKSILIEAGTPVLLPSVTETEESRFYNQFNAILTQRLTPHVHSAEQAFGSVPRNGWRIATLLLLCIPATLGYLIHRPIYVLFRNIARRKTAGTVFYDSVLFAGLLLIYPPVVLIVSLLATWATKSACGLGLLLLMPGLAWCYKTWVATWRTRRKTLFHLTHAQHSHHPVG